jgi:hypothetical protein
MVLARLRDDHRIKRNVPRRTSARSPTGNAEPMK